MHGTDVNLFINGGEHSPNRSRRGVMGKYDQKVFPLELVVTASSRTTTADSSSSAASGSTVIPTTTVEEQEHINHGSIESRQQFQLCGSKKNEAPNILREESISVNKENRKLILEAAHATLQISNNSPSKAQNLRNFMRLVESDDMFLLEGMSVLSPRGSPPPVVSRLDIVVKNSSSLSTHHQDGATGGDDEVGEEGEEVDESDILCIDMNSF
jgi:hypothetical protein